LPATLRLLFPFFVVLALTGAPAAAAEPIPPELAALRESLARTQKLSARFTQTRHWAALQDALVTEGTFEYQKSGRLVWRTSPPAESELVIENRTALLRYPALGTTESIDFSSDPGMGRVFESIGAVLQADLEKLLPLFALTVEGKAPLRLTLTPRTKELAEVVQRIRLSFDGQLRLTRVSLEEAGGDRTDITFRDHSVVTASRG
jgi:outer membrane lipoprotein-sorting protein